MSYVYDVVRPDVLRRYTTSYVPYVRRRMLRCTYDINKIYDVVRPNYDVVCCSSYAMSYVFASTSYTISYAMLQWFHRPGGGGGGFDAWMISASFTNSACQCQCSYKFRFNSYNPPIPIPPRSPSRAIASPQPVQAIFWFLWATTRHNMLKIAAGCATVRPPLMRTACGCTAGRAAASVRDLRLIHCWIRRVAQAVMIMLRIGCDDVDFTMMIRYMFPLPCVQKHWSQWEHIDLNCVVMKRKFCLGSLRFPSSVTSHVVFVCQIVIQRIFPSIEPSCQNSIIMTTTLTISQCRMKPIRPDFRISLSWTVGSSTATNQLLISAVPWKNCTSMNPVKFKWVETINYVAVKRKLRGTHHVPHCFLKKSMKWLCWFSMSCGRFYQPRENW